MPSLFIKKIFTAPFFISLIFFFLFSLAEPSSVYAWATIWGRVTYIKQDGTEIGLNGITVTYSGKYPGSSTPDFSRTFNTQGSYGLNINVSPGDGYYIFTDADCAATDQYIAVTSTTGSLPPGVPAGGYFEPEKVLLEIVNNAVAYQQFFYYVVPATPTPTLTLTPTPIPTPSPTPTPTITPTIPAPAIYCVHETCYRGNTVISGPTPVSGNTPNNFQSNSALTPTPTIVRFEYLPDEYFMMIQLGNIRPTPTPR